MTSVLQKQRNLDTKIGRRKMIYKEGEDDHVTESQRIQGQQSAARELSKEDLTPKTISESTAPINVLISDLWTPDYATKCSSKSIRFWHLVRTFTKFIQTATLSILYV